jgi:D-arabinose 1-dehydrogenase-like Zn-dependent alcohol dehydrogenase
MAQPTVPAGGVVVRVMATGMCRSDWHTWAGHDEEIVFPHVPGHELAGMVLRWAPRSVTVRSATG